MVYTAHDYILLCPAYTMVNGRGEVCDACLDKHFIPLGDTNQRVGHADDVMVSFHRAELGDVLFHDPHLLVDIVIKTSAIV